LVLGYNEREKPLFNYNSNSHIYIYIYIAKILANRTIELKTRRLEIKEKPAEPGRKKVIKNSD
jgi:hypothetical protein